MHKEVYTTMGKLAEYENIFITLFVTRYLPVMVAEKPAMRPLMVNHLQALMAAWSYMAGSLSGLFMPYGSSNQSQAESLGLMKTQSEV